MKGVQIYDWGNFPILLLRTYPDDKRAPKVEDATYFAVFGGGYIALEDLQQKASAYQWRLEFI